MFGGNPASKWWAFPRLCSYHLRLRWNTVIINPASQDNAWAVRKKGSLIAIFGAKTGFSRIWASHKSWPFRVRFSSVTVSNFFF